MLFIDNLVMIKLRKNPNKADIRHGEKKERMKDRNAVKDLFASYLYLYESPRYYSGTDSSTTLTNILDKIESETCNTPRWTEKNLAQLI